MRLIAFVSAFLLLGLTFSCKTKKASIQGEVPTESLKSKSNESLLAVLNQVTAAKFNANALKYSAVADYKDDKNSITLNLELTIKKDQYIWLNAKAFGLVNVARILLKPDSIRMIDYVNKKYISASYNYLNTFIKAPLTFNEIQNLVYGNTLFDARFEDTKLDTSSNILQIYTEIGLLTQKATYNSSLKVSDVSLSEQGNTREMAIKYGSFERVGENSLPSDILINIKGEKKVDCHFTMSNFALDVNQDPSFVVPKSYKVEKFN
jgi:hypothetical protein